MIEEARGCPLCSAAAAAWRIRVIRVRYSGSCTDYRDDVLSLAFDPRSETGDRPLASGVGVVFDRQFSPLSNVRDPSASEIL